MDKISKISKLKWIGYLILEISLFSILLLIIAVLFMIIIATCSDNNEDLGNGYVYYDEWKDITGPMGHVDIPATVLHFAYDDTYIIASQDFTRCSPIYMYDLGDYQDANYLSKIDTDGDGIYYWIVFKKSNKNIVCGTESEFVKKCDSIGIADRLTAKIIK